jgi:hypothetical protein
MPLTWLDRASSSRQRSPALRPCAVRLLEAMHRIRSGLLAGQPIAQRAISRPSIALSRFSPGPQRGVMNGSRAVRKVCNRRHVYLNGNDHRLSMAPRLNDE